MTTARISRCWQKLRASLCLLILTATAYHPLALKAESSEGQESDLFKKIEKEEDHNIFRYKDIYIISGIPDTKIQLSFKLKIVRRLQLFIGYSQLMFWDLLKKDSSPFRDIAYNPEIFYNFELGHGFWRNLSIGIEHRSNGKDSLESRSFDRAFVQSDNEFGFGHAKVSWSLRLFGFYDLDKTNRDLREYQGFWESTIGIASLFDAYFPSKTEIYFRFFPGGIYSNTLWKGGRELGIKFRARIFGFMPYILLQAYSGHSESLLDYDENVIAYRAGFVF